MRLDGGGDLNDGACRSLSLAVPTRALPFVQHTIERLAPAFPGSRFELRGEHVLITPGEAGDAPGIRAQWHAALLGEIVFDRERPFRQRVHERLFGR